MTKTHSFHIPVMGIGYTIDTPLKVSHFGIDSVMFISDDMLIERMRKLYCNKNDIPYQEITNKEEDYRAKRITSYLNLINKLSRQKFDEIKNTASEKNHELKAYFNMLPDSSTIKQEFKNLTDKYFNIGEIKKWLKENLSMGSIDVNIMTKLDKDNYRGDEKLPVEYNDAHAALRGFANSDLESSIVFSAGMNSRLFGYMERFEDFYPNESGYIKKKIILKVSDYRSALIQGKFLAKKGLWVSEYRVESGLNCGGHAFATDGYLMGPILAEFRDKREELIQTVHSVLTQALMEKDRILPSNTLPIKVTAQGGVGTAEEHQFLLDHYQVDKVGWGTPFLLVPEVTNVDEKTSGKLMKAKEDDLYLSNVSPLGIPFNNLRGNTKDQEKMEMVAKGKPGSSCPKGYLSLNKEMTERAICTASHKYIHLKTKEIKKANISDEEFKKQYDKLMEPSCLCVGLSTSATQINNIDHKSDGQGVLVCPGPNLAYFSKKLHLSEMIEHIYGRINVMERTDRPNMFIKELNIYIDYLRNKLDETKEAMNTKQEKYFLNFSSNLNEGVQYYHALIEEVEDKFQDTKSSFIKELDQSKIALQLLCADIDDLVLKPALVN
jgi:hypothetical protein